MRAMLRNREVRRLLTAFSLLGAAAAIRGFSIDCSAGVLVLILSAAFIVLFWVFAKYRYDKIDRLSEQIDRVLHNSEHLLIAESEEGELSVLQSEIIKMTQRIREQNKALQREKEHLADSLADIAHQLRTPLTSANLILTLLETGPDKIQQKELLTETKELYAQMEWLINSLLKLSRLDAGVVEFQSSRIEVGSLVRASVQPLLFSMELHNIILQTEAPENMEIQGDFGWLSEAVRNIVKNCMESVGDNGRIEIYCEDNPLFTRITIRDSGPGIPAEDMPFLFERFYRGKNSDAAGYGIGLALCRTIIMRQGGTVSAKNHPEGGAVFTIRFLK